MALPSDLAFGDLSCSDTDCDLAFGDLHAFAAGDVGFFLPPAVGEPLGSLPGPPPPRRRRRLAGEADAGKSRGNYNCSKCGQPKRGHVCVFRDGPRAEHDKPGGGRRADTTSKRKAGNGATLEADEPRTAADRRVRRKPAAPTAGAEKRNAATPVTPALGIRGEAKRPPRKLDLLQTPVAAGFAAPRSHDFRLSSVSRSGRRKPAAFPVSLPPMPPPRLAFPARQPVPAALPFPGVFLPADAAWLRVFTLLPVEALATAACVSRRFRWLSRRVLLASVEATLVLRSAKPTPESAVAGVLRAAPLLQALELVASPGAPLTDLICARVVRAAPALLATVCLSVSPGGVNLVTSAGVLALAAAPGITALQLDGAAAVTSLTLHAPQLRRFALRGAPQLSSVQLQCPALEALDLDLAPSHELPAVPRRAASASELPGPSSFTAGAIDGCPALRSLSLCVPSCGDAAAYAIAAAPCAATLRSIALPQAGPSLSDAGLTALIAACPALESFELSESPAVTCAAFQSLGTAQCADKLVSFMSTGCPGLTRSAISAVLPSLRSLRLLDVAHSLVAPPAALAPPRKRATVVHAAAQAVLQPGMLLLASPSLRFVSLGGCNAVSSLQLNCPSLRGLGLRGSAVQDVEFVAPAPQLRVLDGSNVCRVATGSDALANIWGEGVQFSCAK